MANIKLNGEIAFLNLSNRNNSHSHNFNMNGGFEFNEKPWLITRHSYSKNNIGFKLQEGDVLKLGKIIFKVKEIRIKQDQINEKRKNILSDKLRDRTLIDNIHRENFQQLENEQNEYSDYLRMHLGLNILNQTNQILEAQNNYNTNNLRQQHTNDFTSKPSEIRVIDNKEEKLLLKDNKKRKYMLIIIFQNDL